ncbi:MAG: acyltransferase [Burkholderiaceae bacterium]|nr:acyltransferase [Burkholderiaceae bacterium]
MGIRFLFWVCRALGRLPFRLFTYPLVAWYIVAKPGARKASRKYLRKVMSARGDAEPGLRHVMAHFVSFAENILDKFWLWSGLPGTNDVLVRNDERLLHNMRDKRGFLLICAHFGNMELCKMLSMSHDAPKITMLVHTKHAQAFNNLLGQLDPRSQMNVMQVTEISPATVVLLTEKVHQGECVVIAGDRIPVSPAPRIAAAGFFGELAPFPVGPYVLASLMQCPVYLMFVLQQKNRTEVCFEFFRETIRLPKDKRDTELAQLASGYAARLEHYCMLTPLQWFNFYDFWQMPESALCKND